MYKPSPCRQAAGFIFTSLLGTFLHFFFDLSGRSVFAALFSAVNESIWEHMKLIFYPMFLFALIESRLPDKPPHSFWCVKLAGILLGLTLIPVLYYTYTGALGISFSWLNVTIFFLAAGAAFLLENRLFRQKPLCSDRAALVLLCVISMIFTVLTFYPPRIPFFQDPVTGTYGFRP